MPLQTVGQSSPTADHTSCTEGLQGWHWCKYNFKTGHYAYPKVKESFCVIGSFMSNISTRMCWCKSDTPIGALAIVNHFGKGITWY